MTTVLHEAAVTRRTRPVRLGATLTILLAAQLMAVLDVSVVNVGAASIRADLHTSGAGLQLVIAGYLIAYSVLLITGARVGAILGPRRVFLAGLATFTLASLACAVAAGAGTLTAFRFIQGAGAALMIPQVFSIIQRHWTGPARARALGHYGAVAAGGVVVGQIAGGVLVTADLFGLQWRSVFLVNVPIGLALLVIGPRVLPRDEPGTGRRLDLPGLLALAATVLALVVPLIFGPEQNWPAWCWASLVASAVLFLGFVAVQRRATHPLMPGRVLRAPGMLPALGALTLMMAPYGGYLFSVALHLQNDLGFTPLRAGLTFVPMGVCFAIASLNWRRLPAQWHRSIIAVALAGATVSLVLVGLALRGGGAPGWLFFATQVPFGLSSGLAYSPTVNQALARVQPADAPDASGLVTTIVQLAQVVGLAGVGSIYLALMTHHSSAVAVSTATFVEAGLAAGAVGCALALLRRR